ncbi:hypothetical protein BGZ82_011264 [Podila clonocystis]|nr:hypothetical protein BGZ82_011264 [Podila clonocystis]
MLMMKERFDSALRSVVRLENEVEALKLDNRGLRMDLKQDNVEYHRAEITGLGDVIMSRLDKSHGSSSNRSYTLQRPPTGREAIQQWEEGDPENGLTVPLRNLSAEWRRRSGAHYIRKLIFKEYEHFDRDADKMHTLYGANMTGVVSKFVKAICKRHRRQTNGAARKKKRTRGRADSDSDDNVYLEQDEEDEQVEALSVVATLDDDDFGPPPVVKFEGGLSQLHVVPKINHWRQAIQQWEHGDPERGLLVLIRDWPLEWHRTDRINKKYHNRRRIVDEYRACGRRKEQRQRRALEVAGRVDDDDEDEVDVWEDVLEEAEVEVKEEEEEPTLVSKMFKSSRVQPRRQARTAERYRDD